MSTKENEMITPQDFEEVEAYVKENYQLSAFKRIMTYSTAARPFECPEGFTASILVCFYEGKYSSVAAYMSVMSKEQRDFKYEGVKVERAIFSLDELKEFESKINETIDFALKLGLWK